MAKDGRVRIDNVEELSLPHMKHSVFHATQQFEVEYEMLQLDDMRITADVMKSLRRNAVVLQAFQLRFPDIDANNVGHCTSAYLSLKRPICKERMCHNANTGERIATLSEVTPTFEGRVVCSEIAIFPCVAELRPFVGWKMFVICEIQTFPGVSRLIGVQDGGQLGVLTAEGLLTMSVPPNAFTQPDEPTCVFSVNMDMSVMEFEGRDGACGPTSPIVECRPSGACFSKDSSVTISVPLLNFGTALQQFSDRVPEVWVSDSSNSEWHPLLDSNGRTVHATIECTKSGGYLATFSTLHFSRFIVLFRNRVADALGIVSLYKYKMATMSSHISKLMDMPDRDGQRLFSIRVDFQVDEADNQDNHEFRQLAPYSSHLRLPYGDIRVTIDSDVIQPIENEEFERHLDFCDGSPGFVQFECQVPHTNQDIITPEMIIAAVTVSRWRRGIFRNDPVQLQKVSLICLIQLITTMKFIETCLGE